MHLATGSRRLWWPHGGRPPGDCPEVAARRAVTEAQTLRASIRPVSRGTASVPSCSLSPGSGFNLSSVVT